MTMELQELLDQVAAIPASNIEEPDLKVGPEHHVVGKIDDLEMRQYFTACVRKKRELENLHSLVNGPMKVTGTIPDRIKGRMFELQDQLDLLYKIFYYTIFRRWQLFDKQFIHVHQGWLVSWSRKQTPAAAFPNLGLVPDCSDDSADNGEDAD